MSLMPLHSAVAANEIIDFSDATNVDRHRPILVAHRGGVVAEDSPECSLTAIRRAAQQGYDMVELDIRRSNDGVPIVFHDDSLETACGKAGRVADFSANDLETFAYLASTDRIARLDSALQLCRQVNLGVMLDLKVGRDSPEFLERLAALLRAHGLVDSTVTFSGSATARRVLSDIWFTPTAEELRRLRNGEALVLDKRFWFGLPKRLQSGDVGRLQAAGALVIPAINTFRYPGDRHFELAKRDVERLSQQGVDGFQIDSVYFSLFDRREERRFRSKN